MKRGEVKHGRVIASKPDTNKTFKSVSDQLFYGIYRGRFAV